MTYHKMGLWFSWNHGDYEDWEPPWFNHPLGSAPVFWELPNMGLQLIGSLKWQVDWVPSFLLPYWELGCNFYKQIENLGPAAAAVLVLLARLTWKQVGMSQMWSDGLGMGMSQMWSDSFRMGMSQMWSDSLEMGVSEIWSDSLEMGMSHIWSDSLLASSTLWTFQALSTTTGQSVGTWKLPASSSHPSPISNNTDLYIIMNWFQKVSETWWLWLN